MSILNFEGFLAGALRFRTPSLAAVAILLAGAPPLAGVSASELCTGDTCYMRWCETHPACGEMETCMLQQSFSCETGEATSDPYCPLVNVWNMCASSCSELEHRTV
jgi:hypothetical protein